MPVAPHLNKELDLVLEGTKPLAAVEAAKDYEGYLRAIEECIFGDLTGKVKDEEIVFTLDKNKHLIAEYEALLNTGVKQYGIKEYHRRMGKLFGYSPQDIEDFINAEVQCNCTKCTGKK